MRHSEVTSLHVGIIGILAKIAVCSEMLGRLACLRPLQVVASHFARAKSNASSTQSPRKAKTMHRQIANSRRVVVADETTLFHDHISERHEPLIFDKRMLQVAMVRSGIMNVL
jgi:hypothetical protein